MYIFLAIVLMFVTGVFFFMQRPAFGRKPGPQRKQAYNNIDHYRNGVFNNLEHTPTFAEGVTYRQVFTDLLLRRNPARKPKGKIPAMKTNLHQLSREENIVTWFGHSSYFLQVDGKRILVDPVFSGNASPIRGTMRSFPGSDVYVADDMPDIDILLITHDHWDHLDHHTIMALKPRISQVCTSLGVGEHLESWGFPSSMIREMNWGDQWEAFPGYRFTATPARHFSGRSFTRNVSLWSSFILETPTHKIFLGGDSGYGQHFKKIGAQYGPFDLAILECGQYDLKWKNIHLMPEEVVPAAKELGASKTMIVHWGKFPLANHNWNEPPAKVTRYAAEASMPLLTPMIGEKIDLRSIPHSWQAWWDLPEAGS